MEAGYSVLTVRRNRTVWSGSLTPRVSIKAGSGMTVGNNSISKAPEFVSSK